MYDECINDVWHTYKSNTNNCYTQFMLINALLSNENTIKIQIKLNWLCGDLI